jgi:outer membrane protein OmpA-like peptidoglycan-associated protein
METKEKTMIRTSIAMLALCLACATANPPQELVDARAAYVQAARGPAATYKPDELHKAQVSLDKAEDAFKSGSNRTQDFAYVAQRSAQIAEADALAAQAVAQRNEAASKLAAAQSQTLDATKGQLLATREQLGEEAAARRQAQVAAKEALDKLAAANVAKVNDEPRGTVITLPGSVLFASGKATLLSSDLDKLSQVADVLKDEPNHSIVVEGHTDSRGSDALNQGLSLRRADAVRTYLIGKGITSDRIEATGAGSSRPIADNATAEGRADNRRVEIIVKPIEPK